MDVVGIMDILKILPEVVSAHRWGLLLLLLTTTSTVVVEVVAAVGRT
jgi:hypothetical protein